MKKTKLAKAIGFAIAGVALTAGPVSTASASNTMYNVYNAGAAIGTGGTDGWTTSPSFVGTASPATAPFSAVGDVINWGVELTAAGDSAVISSQDSLKYGISADIDTAKGAWNDKGPAPGPVSGGQGWGHNTDVGLFRSSVTQQVTLSAASLQAGSGGWNNFGITVFTGSDTNVGGYNHHGGWNVGYRPPSNANPNIGPATLSNPLGTAGLTYLTYTDNSTVSFTANAGQVYSILLGGYAGAGNFGPHDGYVLNVSSVPVPGAVWLFGSAMAGLIGFGRRKNKSVAFKP